MRKIPTLFVRDPDDMRRVLREVHPDCQWVLDGEGVATRKIDGVCMMLDEGERWWARREVKPDKTPPPNYQAIETDPVTGKTVGWEPVEQSSFYKLHCEALSAEEGSPAAGTYELIGPKVNRNPEGAALHELVSHGDTGQLADAPRDFDGLRDWLLAHKFEGIVWHHPDGRMAKLKGRDFPAEGGSQTRESSQGWSQ